MKKNIGIICSILLAGLLVGCSNVQTSNGQLSSNEGKVYDSDSKLYFTETFSNQVPESIGFKEKFNGGHPKLLSYVFVRAVKANIRKEPGNSPIVSVVGFNDKIELIGTVNNQGTIWYKVKDHQGRVGYVSDQVVDARTFRMEKALNKIKDVESFIDEANKNGEKLGYINSYAPNPDNVNFKREKDKYGNSLDQNVAGYYEGEMIVVPDRSIVKILSRDGDRARIKVSSMKEPYVDVNSSRIVESDKLENLPIRKAIAIDKENQNMTIFEKINEKWTVVSYVYTKTGMESKVGFETPVGNFLAAFSRYEMLYNSEIGDKEGYARYATRFSGGGYLHGTPLNYEEEVNKQYFVSQKEWTVGTLPGTRKCIRTSEDHAKFVFNWVLNNNPNNGVNTQVIKDNVLFVVF